MRSLVCRLIRPQTPDCSGIHERRGRINNRSAGPGGPERPRRVAWVPAPCRQRRGALFIPILSAASRRGRAGGGRGGARRDPPKFRWLGVLVSGGTAAPAFLSDHRPDHLYSGRISQESLSLGLGGLESLTVGRIDVFFGDDITRLSEGLLEIWNTDFLPLTSPSAN